MGKVFTEDTVLKCAAPDNATVTVPLHGGTLSTSGTTRLKVDGHKVLTAVKVGATIKGPPENCQTPNNPPTQVPCTKVLMVTHGTATKLRVDGEFVGIDTLDATTNGTPSGTIAVDSNLHSRLETE
jgi:hypothetical protein